MGTGTVRVTMAIYGLSCGGGGSMPIERALAQLPGVIRVYVNPATEMAYVEYTDGQVEPPSLLEAVHRAGFDAGEVQVRSAAPAGATAATAKTFTVTSSPGAAGGRSATPVAVAAAPTPTWPISQALDESGPRERVASSRSNGESTGVVGLREARVGGPGGSRAPSGAGDPQTNHTLRLALLGGFLVLLLAVGLGLSGSQTRAGSEVVHSVTMNDSGFEPATLVLPAGRPLILKLSNGETANGSWGSDSAESVDTTHEFAVDELGIDVKLGAGESRVLTLPPLRPGMYAIYCSMCCGGQVGRNMGGTIIVHDPDAGSQPQ